MRADTGPNRVTIVYRPCTCTRSAQFTPSWDLYVMFTLAADTQPKFRMPRIISPKNAEKSARKKVTTADVCRVRYRADRIKMSVNRPRKRLILVICRHVCAAIVLQPESVERCQNIASLCPVSVNTRRWHNVGLMLVQSRRQVIKNICLYYKRLV